MHATRSSPTSYALSLFLLALICRRSTRLSLGFRRVSKRKRVAFNEVEPEASAKHQTVLDPRHQHMRAPSNVCSRMLTDAEPGSNPHQHMRAPSNVCSRMLTDAEPGSNPHQHMRAPSNPASASVRGDLNPKPYSRGTRVADGIRGKNPQPYVATRSPQVKKQNRGRARNSDAKRQEALGECRLWVQSVRKPAQKQGCNAESGLASAFSGLLPRLFFLRHARARARGHAGHGARGAERAQEGG